MGARIRNRELAELDRIIEDITVDAYGEDEQLWAFRQAFEDNIALPCGATVLGAPVQILKFDYDGNERRGLTAVCRSAGRAKHVVSAAEVVMSAATKAGRYLAAYRKWIGIAPFPPGSRAKSPSKSDAGPLRAGELVELVILSVTRNVARCRLPGEEPTFTFRGRIWDVVPGQIAVVRTARQWTYGGNPYLSGSIESTRLDPQALRLAPLRLEERGIWNPKEHYWGDPGEPIGAWARKIVAHGPRPVFEMEQILPGADSEDPFSDPIIESNDLKSSGDSQGAVKILMDLCRADLRCLDAHAHLGNIEFDRRPADAIRHYEAGFRIGELSFGREFTGLLPWGRIDNCPFLRRMHGFGLCLWRLGRRREALDIFQRMLWLNPTDNQGVRLILPEVRAGKLWHDD